MATRTAGVGRPPPATVVQRPGPVAVVQRPASVTVRPFAPQAREVFVPAHPLAELGPRRMRAPGFVDLNPFTDLRARR